jgi:quercetin dioxygenase-like cupin family protein
MKLQKLLIVNCLLVTSFFANSETEHERINQQIKSAPNKGVIEHLETRLTAVPFLFNLDRQPVEQMGPLLKRQYFHGSQSTFVRWVAKKRAEVPVHKHPNEQVSWILSGEAKVYSGGKEYTMKAGDIMVFPVNIPHSFTFTEDTVAVDIFTPVRQDWVDGTANYFK